MNIMSIIELVESSKNSNIYKYKFFCTERIKNEMKETFPYLSDDSFQILPDEFVNKEMKDVIYVIPTNDSIPVKFCL